MIATILAVQTQILYNPLLNLMINITAFFLLTFFYKNEWFLRLFISFAFFIIGGLAEGSAWMIGRMLFSFEMNDVNNLWLFPFICALGVAIELIYVNIVFQAISFFKRHQSKMTMFIIFLIAVLILCFVYMVVTFADTAYSIDAADCGNCGVHLPVHRPAPRAAGAASACKLRRNAARPGQALHCAL